jgi:hypothetical protein
MADANPAAKPVSDPIQWNTISEGNAEPETKIVMEEIGDKFRGIYLGMRQMPANENGAGYQQARFEGVDNSGINGTGEVYFINANYSLRDGLKTVRTGTLTQFEWVDELDTGQSQPMRVFRVETARIKTTRKST